jgi:hypothetical protein
MLVELLQTWEIAQQGVHSSNASHSSDLTQTFAAGISAYRKNFCTRKLFSQFSYGNGFTLSWVTQLTTWCHWQFGSLCSW